MIIQVLGLGRARLRPSVCEFACGLAPRAFDNPESVRRMTSRREMSPSGTPCFLADVYIGASMDGRVYSPRLRR